MHFSKLECNSPNLSILSENYDIFLKIFQQILAILSLHFGENVWNNLRNCKYLEFVRSTQNSSKYMM